MRNLLLLPARDVRLHLPRSLLLLFQALADVFTPFLQRLHVLFVNSDEVLLECVELRLRRIDVLRQFLFQVVRGLASRFSHATPPSISIVCPRTNAAT